MRRYVALVTVLALTACSPSDGSTDPSSPSSSTTTTTSLVETTTTTPPSFGVTSPAFGDGEAIPTEFTCDGADVSPELNIVGLPERTQSIVVIVDDPDAPLGTWTHWVESDLAAAPGSVDLPRDTPPLGIEAVNSWNLGGYMGPCPPAGEEHRYVFTIFAIDDFLELPAGVDSDAVRTAMDGHVVDSAHLTGVYGR